METVYTVINKTLIITELKVVRGFQHALSFTYNAVHVAVNPVGEWCDEASNGVSNGDITCATGSANLKFNSLGELQVSSFNSQSGALLSQSGMYNEDELSVISMIEGILSIIERLREVTCRQELVELTHDELKLLQGERHYTQRWEKATKMFA
jgi:hypothetical protein